MIKHLCICLATLGLLAGCSNSDDQSSGREPDSDACDVLGLKIINGSSCSSNRSAVVRLIYVGNTGNGFACSGTLIAANKVLTAAHCVYSDLENLTRVPADGLRISSDSEGTTLARSTSISAHPKFEAILEQLGKRSPFKSEASEFADLLLSTGFPDVAVVTLDRNLNLPTLPVYVSHLPDSGSIISIFGFGLTVPGGSSGSARLVSGEMDIERSGRDNFTAIFDGSGSNTCQGDSGGPALISPQDDVNVTEVAVTGITSLGFGSNDSSSCTQGEISVFTATAGTDVSTFILSLAPNARFL